MKNSKRDEEAVIERFCCECSGCWSEMDLKLVVRSYSQVSSFEISCLRFIAFFPYFELRSIVARMRVSSSDSLKRALRAAWVDSFSDVSPSRRSHSLDSLASFFAMRIRKMKSGFDTALLAST